MRCHHQIETQNLMTVAATEEKRVSLMIRDAVSKLIAFPRAGTATDNPGRNILLREIVFFSMTARGDRQGEMTTSTDPPPARFLDR
jgi:hypothetical protein